MSGGLYKYVINEDRYTINSAEELKRDVMNHNHPDAFVVPHINGERIDLYELASCTTGNVFKKLLSEIFHIKKGLSTNKLKLLLM